VYAKEKQKVKKAKIKKVNARWDVNHEKILAIVRQRTKTCKKNLLARQLTQCCIKKQKNCYNKAVCIFAKEQTLK
jgi:hypothetical protein